MRTNLKFIGAVLFTIIFFVGGFLVKTLNIEAANSPQSFNVSYSLSPVISTINSDGSVTTMILVGCAPKSGDLYDINTGKPCTNNLPPQVLIGCAARSGDAFDINTGKPCMNYVKPVLIGCATGSGDAFDINTGKLCTNDTSIINLSKTSIITKITPISSIINPQLTSNTDITVVTNKAPETSPVASNLLKTLPIEGGQDDLSGREKIKDSITDSASRVGSIMKGPMSIWIILLIILILLGGGYGIYSLIKNPSTTNMPLNKFYSHTVSPVEKKVEPIKTTQPINPTIPEVKNPPILK